MNDHPIEASWILSKNVTWYKWTAIMPGNRKMVGYSTSADRPPFMELAAQCEKIEPPPKDTK